MLGLLVASGRAAAQEPASDSVRVTGDVGFVAASGNADFTTLSFGEQFALGAPAWELNQDFSLVYSRSNGETSANQYRANGRIIRHIGPRLGLYTSLHYERNPLAGIPFRMEEGAGLTWKAVDGKRDQLDLAAGGTLVQQRSSVDTTAGFPAAQSQAVYQHSFNDRTYLQQRLEWIPDFRAFADYRLNWETLVVAPLSRRLAVRISYVVHYDNLPEPGFASTDLVFTSGFQVSL